MASETPPRRGIDDFWESERPGEGTVERVVPTGRSQVVIDLDSGVATLVGPRTVSAVVEIPRRAVGFSLTGTGLAHIVGGDASYLVDSTIDLGDLNCQTGQVIDSDLKRGAAVRELASSLVSRFEVDERISLAERLLRSGAPAQALAEVCEFDRRRFVPAFRNVVGLAPKHYEILVRLQRATDLLRSAQSGSLASIAFELGFADQAHMTRDLRRLAGCTPRQLQRLPSGPVHHVPLAEGST